MGTALNNVHLLFLLALLSSCLCASLPLLVMVLLLVV